MRSDRADGGMLEPLRHPRFEQRLRFLAWVVALPGLAVGLVLLWSGDFAPASRWVVTVGLLLLTGFLISLVRTHVVFPLRVVANLLQAVREHDYSLRARHARGDDALGEVLIEVNALSEGLKAQRLEGVEASALLRRVVAEIDIVILTFDDGGRLRLVNRAGERLLGAEAPRLIGRPAGDLGLAACLEGEDKRTMEADFPGGRGRWALRRSSFRQEGRPHDLVVLTDLDLTLRQEERLAWQRLIRVLGHELNNSLAPIQSMAGTLASMLGRDDRDDEWEEDLRRGLRLISERSASLSHFVKRYGELARLPRPRLAPVRVGELLRRVAALENRVPVILEPGPEVSLKGDREQLEQLLINLVRNAADAALETSGTITIGWWAGARELEIRIDDTGPGLAQTANLFVPFFTTKPGGSGIGLVLCRQIAESHGGSLTLRDRSPGPGCRATLYLPRQEHRDRAGQGSAESVQVQSG